MAKALFGQPVMMANGASMAKGAIGRMVSMQKGSIKRR